MLLGVHYWTQLPCFSRGPGGSGNPAWVWAASSSSHRLLPACQHQPVDCRLSAPRRRRPICHLNNLDSEEDSVFVFLDEAEVCSGS